MERLKKIVKSDIFIIIIINLIILLIFSLLNFINYEEVDDFIIEDILAGYSSTPSCYTIYIHYFLSYLLRVLFNVFPYLNWYFLSLLLFIITAFTIIEKNIIKFLGKKIGILAFLIITSLFFIPALLSLSYTSIAGFLMIAAITEQLLIFFNKSKNIYITYLISGILILFSFLLRYNIFIIYIVFLIIYIIYFLFKKIKVKNIIKFNLIILGILILLGIFNTYIYYSNPIYKNYLEYNKYRGYLQDFININYENDKEIITQTNLNENDIYLFNNFCNSDENIYSSATLKNLYELKLKKNSIFSIFDHSIIKSSELLLKELINKYLFIIICLIITIFTIKNNKKMNILLFLFPFIIHLFFVSIDKSVYRVNIIFYFFSFVSLILLNYNYIISNFKEKHNKKNYLSFIFFILITLTLIYNFIFIYYNKFCLKPLVKDSYNQLFEYTLNNTDKSYICYTFALQYRYFCFNNFSTQNKYVFSNIKTLGSWDSTDERYFEFKNKYNIDSLYNSLIENENCYLIVDNKNNEFKNLNSIIKFLNDHYTSKKIKYFETKNINNIIFIYKLYTLD